MARPKNKDKYLIGRSFYIKGMTVPSIALELKVSERTIYDWRKTAKNEGDDWDFYRALTSSGNIEGLALDIYADFGILLKRMRELQDSENISVSDLKEIYTAYDTMLRATRKVSPFVDKRLLSLDLLDLLEQFVQKSFPEFKDAIKEIKEPFGLYLLEIGFFNKS